MQVVLCEVSEAPVKAGKRKYALRYAEGDFGQKFNGRALYLALQKYTVEPNRKKAGEQRKWK